MWVVASVGASVFLFTIAFLGNASRKMGRQTDEEWIFSNFYEKIYDAFFLKKDPREIARKLGMSQDKYIKNCRVLRIDPRWRREAGMRMTGIMAFGLSLCFAVFLRNIVVAVIGVGIFFCMGPYKEQQIGGRAKEKRKRMANELPRFIDLFATAAQIGIPVESAIKTTAKEIPCIVSEELLMVMAETEIGAKSWQRALEEVALRYDVGVFSDFVLALVAGYEKGIPISEIVGRKSMEIKQSNLLEAKERAAKLSNTVLLPVMVFKILPLLIIMLIPIMMQINSM